MKKTGLLLLSLLAPCLEGCNNRLQDTHGECPLERGCEDIVPEN